MRGSTAAGINNSLLPRDCGCGEFADGAVLGRGLFFLVFVGFPVVLSGERLLFPGICEEFADGSVWGRGFFPLPFVAFGSFGTGEGLLWYGICARCAKQAPVVRGAFSGALGAQNRLLWYGSDTQLLQGYKPREIQKINHIYF